MYFQFCLVIYNYMYMRILKSLLFCFFVMFFLENSINAQEYKPFELPYEQMKEILLLRQERYEREMENNRRESLMKMEQVKMNYNSFKQYPQRVSNGWHSVMSMNNYDNCSEVKVFVEDNKIKEYVIDNWFSQAIGSEPNISNSKAMLSLLLNDNQREFVEIYFIDFINNPNSKASPPLKEGSVSFWSNEKRGGKIKIFMEDEYIGELDSYFEERPNCGVNGTLSITYKPGIYNFKASSNKYNWSGTFTIEPDNCILKKIGK